MWGCERRLRRDLPRWRQLGWVTEEGERQIAAELGRSWMNVGVAPALAMLGAIMLGFAAMSFVAANWQAMPKLARLVVLFGSVWAAYGISGVLLQRGNQRFADAAVLLATSLFGASIMLIAQMYHMEGNPPDAVLTWSLGTLLAGLVLGSQAALALAMVLAALWSGWQADLIGGVHWNFLPLWAAISAAFYWKGWRPGLQLAGLALGGWVIMLGYQLDGGHAHGLVTAIGLAIAAAALAGEVILPEKSDAATTVMGYGAAVAFAGLMTLQFQESPSTSTLIVLAILTLALTLALVLWGSMRGHRGLLWLGYAGFSVEVMALYFKTIATLMGSSLFFLTTGLVIIALSGLAWRLHARFDALEEIAP